jgi:ubiquinone biosynthesis protein COQ4
MQPSDLVNNLSLFDRTNQQHNHYQILILFKTFLSMLSGNTSLEIVNELTEALIETSAYDLAAQCLKQDPACEALIRDRYIPPTHDLDTLLTYPKNSLGYIYAKTIKAKGFDPNLHADMIAQSDAYYVELRLSQTHDIWHIVTGFDTSVIDEIGLQAFHLAQFPYPLATVLVANSLMFNTLLAPEELSQLLRAIARGFEMGKSAKLLFSQKWEEAWEKPLGQWREELCIKPADSVTYYDRLA